jgi:hypothetical protein
MPSKQFFVNPFSRVSLHIGKPIDISQFTDISEAMEVMREKIAEGMKA